VTEAGMVKGRVGKGLVEGETWQLDLEKCWGVRRMRGKEKKDERLTN